MLPYRITQDDWPARKAELEKAERLFCEFADQVRWEDETQPLRRAAWRECLYLRELIELLDSEVKKGHPIAREIIVEALKEVDELKDVSNRQKSHPDPLVEAVLSFVAFKKSSFPKLQKGALFVLSMLLSFFSPAEIEAMNEEVRRIGGGGGVLEQFQRLARRIDDPFLKGVEIDLRAADKSDESWNQSLDEARAQLIDLQHTHQLLAAPEEQARKWPRPDYDSWREIRGTPDGWTENHAKCLVMLQARHLSSFDGEA